MKIPQLIKAKIKASPPITPQKYIAALEFNLAASVLLKVIAKSTSPGITTNALFVTTSDWSR